MGIIGYLEAGLIEAADLGDAEEGTNVLHFGAEIGLQARLSARALLELAEDQFGFVSAQSAVEAAVEPGHAPVEDWTQVEAALSSVQAFKDLPAMVAKLQGEDKAGTYNRLVPPHSGATCLGWIQLYRHEPREVPKTSCESYQCSLLDQGRWRMCRDSAN